MTARILPGGADRALPQRFYSSVTVAEAAARPGSGDRPAYRILLDGRGVRTPARLELAVPSRALAEVIAAEWQAQAGHIDPGTMPVTRLVNSSVDGVAGREPEVRAAIVAYGGSDLLCYVADEPRALADRQVRLWGPVRAWAEQMLGVRLVLGAGVMPVAQDPALIPRLAGLLDREGAFALAALHVMTTLTGSVLLALACRDGRLAPAEAWSLAHLDEDYQIEQWGEDWEAAERRRRRWLEMEAAALVLQHASA